MLPGIGLLKTRPPDRTDWAEVKARWNRLAEELGVPRIPGEIPESWKKAYKARLKADAGWWEAVGAELREVPLGVREKGWFTFEFVTSPAKLAKLLGRAYRSEFGGNSGAPVSTRRSPYNEPNKFKGM